MDKEIEKSKSKELTKFQYYTLYFLIFATLGWLMETAYAFSLSGKFVKRGFLYGPLCPIYGCGALILIIFLKKYKNSKSKLFIYSAIIFSVFEYLVSYVLEVLFHSFWWDYSNDLFNLNGRISLLYSFAWGIIALISANHIYPFFEKKLNTLFSKIHYKIQISIINISFIIFIIDTILSCIRYINI